MLSGLNSPKKFRQRLRLPLLGVALTASLVLLVWDRLDARLAAEAARQSAEGQSLAVAAVRADWAASVIPTALTADGAVGEDARRVAMARIDLTIARVRRDDTAPFEQLATATLDAIHGLDRVATDAGAEWAEWLVPRLIEAAEGLKIDRRIALLAKADQTLARLAVRPRRREVLVEAEELDLPPRPPKPETQPPEPPEVIVKLLPPPPMKPEPSRQFASTAPPSQAKPREPADWSPRWEPVQPAPIRPAAPLVSPPTPVAAAPVLSQRESDLRLLAEFVKLAAIVPPAEEPGATSSRGPASLPRRKPSDPFGRERARLSEVRTDLTKRGYRSITSDQVAALLSDDPERRRDLAERLLTIRSGEAARLLLLLAEDPAGEVREAAISVLGSSSSRRLVETAVELATNDRDPRVGRLAEPLRQRLR